MLQNGVVVTNKKRGDTKSKFPDDLKGDEDGKFVEVFALENPD